MGLIRGLVRVSRTIWEGGGMTQYGRTANLVAISLDEAPQRGSERRAPATTAGAGGAPTAPH